MAYNAVKQAMCSAESDRLILLTYETLTQNPTRALEAIYEFTGQLPFHHDFEKIFSDAAEFDARLGTRGLHTVAPKVHSNQQETILPPDLWRSFERDSFWKDPAFNTRGVRVV